MKFIIEPPVDPELQEEETPTKKYRLENLKIPIVSVVDVGAVPDSYWRLMKRDSNHQSDRDNSYKEKKMAVTDEQFSQLQERINALTLLVESLDGDRVTKDDLTSLQEQMSQQIESLADSSDDTNDEGDDDVDSRDEDDSTSDATSGLSEDDLSEIAEATSPIYDELVPELKALYEEEGLTEEEREQLDELFDDITTLGETVSLLEV